VLERRRVLDPAGRASVLSDRTPGPGVGTDLPGWREASDPVRWVGVRGCVRDRRIPEPGWRPPGAPINALVQLDDGRRVVVPRGQLFEGEV